MAKCEAKITYRCNDDCVMEGCPMHEGKLTFDSVTNYYFFNLGGKEMAFESGEMQALIDLLKQLGYRKDLINLNCSEVLIYKLAQFYLI